MSIPNAALQKLVQEIETQAIASQQQIGLVKSQIASKQRDIRLIELTSKEMEQVPKGANVYEGVGKMFVATGIEDVNKRLSEEQKTLGTDVTNLEKRLHYLETTFKNSQNQIEHLFQGGRKP